MELTFQIATTETIDTLVKLRTEVLRAVNYLSDDVDLSNVQRETRAYLQDSLTDGSQTTYFAYMGEDLAGCGSIIFYQGMPTYSNQNGKKAYIMNMYTRPSYRKKGIASQLLALLIEQAKKRGISSVQLEATDMGRLLYSKHGFVGMEHEMKLKL